MSKKLLTKVVITVVFTIIILFPLGARIERAQLSRGLASVLRHDQTHGRLNERPDYYVSTIRAVERQLVFAGRHLASVLEHIFSTIE